MLNYVVGDEVEQVAQAIQVMRQIAVKTIVTEQFKVQVASELERNLQQIDVELQQLEFRSKRLIADIEKRGPQGTSAQVQAEIQNVKQQVDQERMRLIQGRNEMQAQGKHIADLPVDSLFTQFTVQSQVDLHIGDNIFHKLEGGELVIKDGVVQEIKL